VIDDCSRFTSSGRLAGKPPKMRASHYCTWPPKVPDRSGNRGIASVGLAMDMHHRRKHLHLTGNLARLADHTVSESRRCIFAVRAGFAVALSGHPGALRRQRAPSATSSTRTKGASSMMEKAHVSLDRIFCTQLS
jgi:hypothetical protein